jgi:hypothetical protein
VDTVGDVARQRDALIAHLRTDRPPRSDETRRATIASAVTGSDRSSIPVGTGAELRELVREFLYEFRG